MFAGVAIAFSSVVLNLLFVYLAASHFMRSAYVQVSKQNPYVFEAIRFINAVLLLGVFGGSLLYFTFGAETIFKMTKGSENSTGFGDWLNSLVLINLLVAVAAVGIVAKRLDSGQGRPPPKP